jgi:predicted ATPase/DNA-binding XRE family transcriptional regulator
MGDVDRWRASDDAGEQSFGELLAAYRSTSELTQEELAGRAGLSVDAIGLLERGARRSPRSHTVGVLASALRLGPRERESFEAAARRKQRPAALRIPAELRLPSTPFVGRERDLEELHATLARPHVRLLTLTGPPGTGKTRLALEAAMAVAAERRDGAVVVALADLRRPELVRAGILRSLGIDERPAEPPLATVADHCRHRELLLVLDNFEHVLPAAFELSDLLTRCPGLQLLVTSRAALRMRGEHELPVPPLPVPDAGDPWRLPAVPSVRLFLDRVEAAVAGFRLTAGNAPAVAAICRRLDGLPLALELAAPWIKLLTPDELLSRLDRPLELLVDGPRDLPERQRTLRDALRWSCGLLAPESRALLRRLSVFAASAPADAVERVCEAAGPLPGGALPHLAALANHSLIECVPRDGTEARVSMLESVRAYGRELLEDAGEAEATARAHLEHYADLAVRVRAELEGPARASWLDRLGRERHNLRAALGWAVEHSPACAGPRRAVAEALARA